MSETSDAKKDMRCGISTKFDACSAVHGHESIQRQLLSDNHFDAALFEQFFVIGINVVGYDRVNIIK